MERGERRLLWFAIVALWVLVIATVLILDHQVDSLEDRMAELNCVHYIYEDGSAVHIDAEAAHSCLQRELGWP